MAPVAFLIGHGPRGQSAAARTAELARPWSFVHLVEQAAATGTVLSEVAADIPGKTEVEVIHLVEVEVESALAGLAAAVDEVTEVFAGYPALGVAHYVVAMVDREWDDDEVAPLLSLGDVAQAVIVVSRSNEAAGELRPLEEECMASDIAHALCTSDLAKSVKEGTFWLAGASAVYYRRTPILAALMAFHVRAFLADSLLADLPANHTEAARGLDWLKMRLLGKGEHLTELERSPTVGSVVSEIRVDHDPFAEVPPELLVDALRSFVHQTSEEQIKRAQEQIDRNLREHLAGELSALTDETRSVLTEKLRIASAELFVERVAEALTGPLQEIQLALSLVNREEATAEAADEQDGIEQELIKTIHNLPYPAAVAARSVGIGALGIGAYHLLAALVGLDPNLAVLGLAGGLLLSLPLVGQYVRRLNRVSSLRERYLTLAEEHLRERVRQAVLEAAVRELQELQDAAIGASSLLARLRELRESVEELVERYRKLVDDRVLGPLAVTRFSTLLPTTGEVSTADLVAKYSVPDDRIPRLVMKCILQGELGALDLDSTHEALMDAFEPLVRDMIWPDLTGLLQDSASALRTARTVLGTETSPIVKVSHLTLERSSIRRLVSVNQSTPGALTEALGETSIDGRMLSIDTDAAVQIAIRPVPQTLREEAYLEQG